MVAFDAMFQEATMRINPEGFNLQEMWVLNEKTIHTVIDHYKVEEYPENRRSWADIPIAILSGSAHVRRFIPYSEKTRKAIDERRFADARESIGEALLVEVNEASNNAKDLATLRLYLSEIDEEQENWTDALENFETACKYENSLRKAPMSAREDFLRSRRRDRIASHL